MARSAPVGSDWYRFAQVYFDTGIDSFDSKKCLAFRLAWVPTSLFDGPLPEVRRKSALHFPVTVRAVSSCHLHSHTLSNWVEVTERTLASPLDGQLTDRIAFTIVCSENPAGTFPVLAYS